MARERRDTTEQLPIWYLQECLKLSRWSKSGLEWRFRPREHFKSEAAWARWNGRHRRRRAGCWRPDRRYFQILLDGKFLNGQDVMRALLCAGHDELMGYPSDT